MDQQEYEQAAECFRCVLRVAELSSDRLFIEAARVAGWLCTVLCYEHPTGEQLRTARIALGKNLLRLSYEDVGLAESALAAHIDREAVAMVEDSLTLVGARISGARLLLPGLICMSVSSGTSKFRATMNFCRCPVAVKL